MQEGGGLRPLDPQRRAAAVLLAARRGIPRRAASKTAAARRRGPGAEPLAFLAPAKTQRGRHNLVTGHEVATLARMANQIADFFRAYPEAEAVRGVREHMRAFWTRQMLAHLAAHAEEVELDPLVVRAVQDRK